MSTRVQPRLGFSSALLLLAGLLAPAIPAEAQSSTGATLSYRKVFKDSAPEFVEIKVRENGSGTIDLRRLEDEPDPESLEVSPQLAAKMLEMAAELDHFRNTHLDVRRRVANLGEKTFRYERGREAYETTFNYTVNPTAQQLMQVFEGLARQHEHLTVLNRRIRYDRLGVNDALLKFEVDLNRKIIPEPERLLPTLETIANDTRMIEMTRHRARSLIERIRNSRPS